jgi:hypothetical protein
VVARLGQFSQGGPALPIPTDILPLVHANRAVIPGRWILDAAGLADRKINLHHTIVGGVGSSMVREEVCLPLKEPMSSLDWEAPKAPWPQPCPSEPKLTSGNPAYLSDSYQASELWHVGYRKLHPSDSHHAKR